MSLIPINTAGDDFPKLDQMSAKKVVLLLGHGSRDAEGQAQFFRLADLVQQRMGSVKVQAAFLELCDPLVSEGIDTCVKMGAEKVLAVPVFLSDASHVKEDLPVALNEARTRYPQLSILYGRPLGMGKLVQQVLLERLWETLTPEALRPMALLLVGRGSPDPSATQELQDVVLAFKKQVQCHSIAVGFVDRTKPTVPEALEACRASGAQGILILPCLFFPGIVLNRIHRSVQEFKLLHPDCPLITAPCLGVHSKLADLVVTRIHQCESV
jgi:sirohydrochlorin ferrochelatase